ncbi:diguanylate cyclase response regulator [Thiocapsa imhoffii]|uniref:diguanylate cyclase n=2 Tax=Thiocapsa imhoffii TaxID=382777 RepID=A0A9X1BAR2_9GAMM|nr:diguanylate cyclase [Thiocapsa imhoffii]MBK1646428.1 diguanylate cyclase response regulator [Thiocapsa imhoffii]
MRILIVDDVPDNIRVLSHILRDAGYQISAATNGRKALSLASTSKPDLILLDVMMPEMNGYETCAALKADPTLAEIPVIFVTALADVEDETRGFDLGAVDYITKPFNDVIVRRRVQTHLELKQQRDRLARLSYFDSLTALPNRRAFDERLDQEWHRALRNQTSLAIAMIDVDHFKAYNDSRGHQAGDEALRMIAAVLRQPSQRAADFMGRYGGEEFVGLVNGASLDGLRDVVEQLRARVESLHIVHAAPVEPRWITVSIGAALCQPSSLFVPAQILLDAADRALYCAKQDGRNRVHVTDTIPQRRQG